MNPIEVLLEMFKHKHRLPVKKNKAEYYFALIKSPKSIFVLAVGIMIGAWAIEGSYFKKNGDAESGILTTRSFLTSAFDCGTDTVADVDNNIYRTVKIGDQCWFKENLRVAKNPSGAEIVRNCYDGYIDNCNNLGGLYDWDTAMNRSVASGVQGICPNGWHIPRDSEWFILENYLKDTGRTCDADRIGAQDCDGAGTKLKKGGISGFNGFMTGYLHGSGGYYGQDIYTFFWSSTMSKLSPESEPGIFGRFLSKDYSTLYRSYDGKSQNFSVRCLKD